MEWTAQGRRIVGISGRCTLFLISALLLEHSHLCAKPNAKLAELHWESTAKCFDLPQRKKERKKKGGGGGGRRDFPLLLKR